VTSRSPVPIFWEKARGSNVFDVDGNRFVDLVAGFGVAALGHAHPRVADAVARQAHALPHAMGDVYPAEIKVRLLERLQGVLPGDLGHGILSSSGSDAIESALKTALCATGKADVVAFENSYHGLGFGALDTTHRSEFRAPFLDRLAGRTHFAPYGDIGATRALVEHVRPGAILFEPIQGRGGLRIPPPGFVEGLRELADRSEALLIADEIYTGLGRTGHWLASEHAGVVPDVVALGKALGNGFPISVCVGSSGAMDRWPEARGEALHTSTHLGNPQGCAAALEVLAELEEAELPKRATELGEVALDVLRCRLRGDARVREIRGRGLMLGIELDRPELARCVVGSALEDGWIVLADGPVPNTLAITPPLSIDASILERGLERLCELIRA